MESHGCERIKTIGDAYLAVCGMPEPREDHAVRIASAAREMVAWLAERNETAPIRWEMRVGINSGSVIAGIVGTNKYIYDVFGDTVNTTSRMESCSEPMKINISEKTADLLGNRFPLTPRGGIEAEGQGNAENVLPGMSRQESSAFCGRK
jgi:class 3 adenylate cyclase